MNLKKTLSMLTLAIALIAPVSAENTALEQAVIDNYTNIAYENYQDVLLGAQMLEAAIYAFTTAAQEGAGEVELEILMTQVTQKYRKNKIYAAI